MRAIAFVLLLALFALPLASAEEWNLRAGGATLGFKRGVFGAQISNEDGAGVRYWFNATEDGPSALVLTTCYTPGSKAVSYCERHWLHA